MKIILLIYIIIYVYSEKIQLFKNINIKNTTIKNKNITIGNLNIYDEDTAISFENLNPTIENLNTVIENIFIENMKTCAEKEKIIMMVNMNFISRDVGLLRYATTKDIKHYLNDGQLITVLKIIPEPENNRKSKINCISEKEFNEFLQKVNERYIPNKFIEIHINSRTKFIKFSITYEIIIGGIQFFNFDYETENNECANFEDQQHFKDKGSMISYVKSMYVK